MLFSSVHHLITAIEDGTVPPMVLEEAYREMYRLFRTELPDGPIIREGRHVLDKKYLLYYMLEDFDDKTVLSAVRSVVKGERM